MFKLFFLITLTSYTLSLPLNIFKYLFEKNNPQNFYPKKNNILKLNNYTLFEAIKQYQNLLVYFYTDYDTESLKNYSEIIEATNSKEFKEMNITVGKLDLFFNHKIIEKLELLDYPLFILFHNYSNETYDIYYGNNRTKYDIIRHYEKLLKNPIILLNNINDIKKFEKDIYNFTYNNMKLIYYGNNETMIDFFSEVSTYDSFHEYGICNNESVINNYENAKNESIVIIKPYDEKYVYLDADNVDIDLLEEFITENEHRYLMNINEGIYYFEKERTGIVLLFIDLYNNNNNDNNINNNNLKEIFKKLSYKYKGKILFSIGDINKDKNIIKKYNLKNSYIYNNKLNYYNNKDIYLSILDYKDDNFNKWDFNKWDFPVKATEKNIDKFINDWINNKYIRVESSDDIVTEHNETVYFLVADNIREELYDNDLDLFIDFYGDFSENCKRVFKEWEKLAIAMKGSKVRIAQFEKSGNDFEIYHIDTYLGKKFLKI